MKTPILYATLVLVGLTTAQEECVEGKRVTISPGYIVEYRCNKFRVGQVHHNVASHEDCAEMCEANGLDVCSYNAANKGCIVGDPNGREGRSEGTTYMVRVQEEEVVDPFAEVEDPFAQTCEEERDSLRAQKNELRENLDKCHADLEAAQNSEGSSNAPPPTQPSCGVAKWGHGYYEVKHGMTIENCRQSCAADSKCVSYSANKGTTGPINCYLYDKETADTPDRQYTNFVMYDMRCH